MNRSPWPKQLPQLTAEQERIRDDFMRYWHEVLPSKYPLIEKFNHGYAARSARPGTRTLEIGAGLGEHMAFEPEWQDDYWVVELREDMAEGLRQRNPNAKVVVGDCQRGLPFDDHSFDRVLAIHVLEHLPDLPAALEELHRVLKPDGVFVALIPCEGGLAYTIARRVSAQRIFERRYGISYDWFVSSEHINVPSEIVPELERYFTLDERSYFPLRVPVVTANLVIGLTMSARVMSDVRPIGQRVVAGPVYESVLD